MNIPEKGEIVSIENIIGLCKFFGKFDILDRISRCGTFPLKPFSSDGCTKFPDHLPGKDLYVPCFWHDLRYYFGKPGDEVSRLHADLELARDVGTCDNMTVVARAMFAGVSVGGSDKFNNRWKWGFGWEV